MNCTDPPLTTVRQPIESIGKAAVALLVNQTENLSVYPEELLFEPELVVRDSTAPVPAPAPVPVPVGRAAAVGPGMPPDRRLVSGSGSRVSGAGRQFGWQQRWAVSAFAWR